MRIITLLLMPIVAFADYLTPKEIDQLVDSAFYYDTGWDAHYVEKSHYRWNKPHKVFINIEDGDYPVTQAWLDEIYKVTAEIAQLTSLDIEIVPQVRTWGEVRGLIKDKGRGCTVIYFRKSNSSWLGGLHGKASVGGQNVRIHVNADRSEKVIKHIIREELTNSLGLLGDTLRDNTSILWQGHDELINAERFSESDRRILYAYYALDKNSTQHIAHYDEETFRSKIAKVKINDEKVYQGLFADQLPFRPGWLYFNHYPWVYCGRSNSWYYICAHQGGSYLWGAHPKQWSLMTDVFKFN